MATRIQHYDQGDVWTPQGAFTVNNVATDPTTVTVRYMDPSGTVTVLGPVSGGTGGGGITRASAGLYTVAIPLTSTGYWNARFEGTGTAAATEDHQAVVDPSPFFGNGGLDSRALVTMNEAKDWLQSINVDTTNDLELARVINDVSDRFHQEAEREFKVSGTNPQTRVFDVPAGGLRKPLYIDGDYVGDANALRRTIRIGDLAALTSASIISSDWTTVLQTPSNSLIAQRPLVRQAWEPITALEFSSSVTSLSPGMRVSVTGTWGFPSVPGTVRQAVLDAVAATLDRDVENYRQDQAPTGGEGGNTIVIGGGKQRMLSLPPEALAVAWSYRNPNIG